MNPVQKTTAANSTPNQANPNQRNQKKITKIATANQEIQRLSGVVTSHELTIKSQAEEIEQLKELLSKQTSQAVNATKVSVMLKDKLAAKKEKNTGQEDSHHPTQLDLEHYRGEIENAVDKFKELNEKINNLRNAAKIYQGTLNDQTSKTTSEAKLNEFDETFEALKNKYATQAPKIREIIEEIGKKIAEAEYTPFTDAQKKAFSAITRYPTQRLANEEGAFKTEVATCKQTLAELKECNKNTITRFGDTKGHLDYIDNYIHTTNKLAYMANLGVTKGRSFDPNALPQLEPKAAPQEPATSESASTPIDPVKEPAASSEPANVAEPASNSSDPTSVPEQVETKQ